MLLENLPKFAGTDRLAIVCAAEQMTYRELWERTRALAWFLKDNYPSRRPLAIYGDRENDIIVATFAAIAAAKPYVVISDRYPEDRIRHILAHCEAELVLSTSKKAFNFGLPAVPAGEIDRFVEIYGKRAAPTVNYSPDDTACIVYTSGSTGEPKGVEVSYRNVEERASVTAKRTAGRMSADTAKPLVFCTCNLFPYSAVASTEYFGVLGVLGGVWHAAPAAVIADTERLLQYYKEAEPGWTLLSPTLAKKLLSHPDFNGDTLPALRLVYFGGEAVTVDLVGEMRKRLPNIKMYNLYSASEVFAVCLGCLITEETVSKGDRYFPVNDGTFPFLILVDENNVPITEEGREGELAFRSDMVTKGYYKNPELTEKVYFTLPDGTRAYRTGDIGVRRGRYTYIVGRRDNQVKIGANRIELEDVEAHLLQCTAVRDCAAAVGTDEDGVNSLVAYVVPTPEAAAQKRLDVFLQIKSEMMASVECYKVPQKIVFLDELPRSINGKLDRQHLRRMANECVRPVSFGDRTDA